jgi:hypothetical protein
LIDTAIFNGELTSNIVMALKYIGTASRPLADKLISLRPSLKQELIDLNRMFYDTDPNRIYRIQSIEEIYSYQGDTEGTYFVCEYDVKEMGVMEKTRQQSAQQLVTPKYETSLKALEKQTTQDETIKATEIQKELTVGSVESKSGLEAPRTDQVSSVLISGESTLTVDKEDPGEPERSQSQL